MNRIINKYKERGLKSAIVAIVNPILSRFFGIHIEKSSGTKESSITRKIFMNRVLKESNEGYFYVDPMPTDDELTIYYKNAYWGFRSGKSYGVKIRDLIHYDILRKFIPEFFQGEKVIVNFGAGHAGASNLFWFDGFDVINVEPSEIPKSYNSRWTQHLSISELDDSSVDLIYGSHSLEHVQDILSFKSEVKRILKPGGVLFFEVPNAEHPSNGAMKNKIDVPHTYYFKKTFFSSWFNEVLLNDSFDEAYRDSNLIENWKNSKSKNGLVIRALGKID